MYCPALSFRISTQQRGRPDRFQFFCSLHPVIFFWGASLIVFQQYVHVASAEIPCALSRWLRKFTKKSMHSQTPIYHTGVLSPITIPSKTLIRALHHFSAPLHSADWKSMSYAKLRVAFGGASKKVYLCSIYAWDAYISKGTLEMHPMFHFTERRIEAHICICFIAYKVYKESERLVAINKIGMSVDHVLDVAKTITTIKIRMPKDKAIFTKTLFLTDKHRNIMSLFDLSKDQF